MHKKIVFIGFALLLCCGLAATPAGAADESIVGKWKVSAETPAGPRELEFVFKQDSGKLAGTASLTEVSGAFTAVKFEAPNFSADLEIAGDTFRLTGALKDGKFSGSWEQIGSDLRGTWTAVRIPPPASEPAAAATGVSGSWDMLAVTPNGDMTATLDIQQEGEKVTGEIKSDMGSLPLQAASFKEDKLQFDLDLGGNTYRIQAALKEGKFMGGWAPAAGGEGGAWSATRKASVPATAPAAAARPAASAIVGAWNAVASTPDGEMHFVVDLKQEGETLSGTIATPDGSITLQKPAFANEKLTFEVEYMGGTFRIEAVLANDTWAGKWAAVDGSASGSLTAERKK